MWQVLAVFELGMYPVIPNLGCFHWNTVIILLWVWFGLGGSCGLEKPWDPSKYKVGTCFAFFRMYLNFSFVDLEDHPT